mmetsp:Transcript_35260/g.100717  ORF Transcript_35260/g.100717 Transcript_35260/m.100717 type:complete len:81 (-) Transcript_35260:418-660(-)
MRTNAPTTRIGCPSNPSGLSKVRTSCGPNSSGRPASLAEGQCGGGQVSAVAGQAWHACRYPKPRHTTKCHCRAAAAAAFA